MKTNIIWHEKSKCMAVEGELTFSTVTALQSKGNALLIQQPRCVIDLAQVTKCDTCSIILLIGWLRLANKRGISLSFKHISSQMRHLASVHGVAKLLF
jgi:ABC-type transporter Mla MlaB component